MKRIILPFLCGLILTITSCSSGSDVAFIDKTQKAIVSANGQAFKKVMVQGAGKEVTFQGFSNDQKNSIIYFDKVNPGFLVAEGFGLNKNYVLRLVPGKKYTVYIFTDPKDPSAYPIHFRTDYNNNIITEADEDK
jgi:hypothetical protein